MIFSRSRLRTKPVLLMALVSMLVLAGLCCRPQEKKVRVAMCQIVCLDGDRSGNLVRIENALLEAKKASADIACFPETTLYGWVNPEAHTRAHPIPGRDSDVLRQMADKHDIYICIGLAEKEEDRLFDSVILISDEGQILLKHRKMNILTELMTPPYTPGNKVTCAETKFGRVGLLICADTFKMDILQKMADLNPDLVLVPYGWAAEEKQWPEHAQQLHKTVSEAAKTIGAPVIGVDLVGEITHGPWAGMTYGGQSVAVDAQGIIIATARDRERDVTVVQLPLF